MEMKLREKPPPKNPNFMKYSGYFQRSDRLPFPEGEKRAENEK